MPTLMKVHSSYEGSPFFVSETGYKYILLKLLDKYVISAETVDRQKAVFKTLLPAKGLKLTTFLQRDRLHEISTLFLLSFTGSIQARL